MNSQVDTRYYEAVKPNSLAERVFIHARRRIYEDFLRVCQPRADETILDVGVSDVTESAANVLERLYPWPEQITAVGLGSGEEFMEAFSRVHYEQIVPNRMLPFCDSKFDIVACNAVLEHVGSTANQSAFVRELMRVGKRVYLTVPNRFFPVEQHTAIPFLHWTDFTHACACRILGKGKWADPRNLILMSRRRLRRTFPQEFPAEIGTTGIRLGTFSSNLYLFGKKT